MNVVIIEDETLSAKRLEKMLHSIDVKINVMAILPSVKASVQWLADNSAPLNLIFMDIHLEDDHAFKIIEETALSIPTIFTTAYDNYAIKAFKTNSVDYLLKPIEQAELEQAITKFKQIHFQQGSKETFNYQALLEKLAPTSYKTRFMANVGNKLISIPTENIAYFYYKDKATWAMTKEGKSCCVEYSLDKLIKLLDPSTFFRINRSYIVSYESIQSMKYYSTSKLKLDIAPITSEEVFVSSDRLTAFKEWLGK
ncbi:LytTR family two component transcriptional regulator [Chitinophaga skermanii]|uniref:LytTR family two component transcriptional regulator n=1 Tax=Chitinophaga skermanii TaxID=331697 RepID=A0A327QX61_9BACT|nr:LytTR family DNA-binding domain-containing protein [Chitinophaga skermanii]RAJ08212.1 LytTR family two component transcriptional regulator [Chitinophaga skermanii]